MTTSQKLFALGITLSLLALAGGFWRYQKRVQTRNEEISAQLKGQLKEKAQEIARLTQATAEADAKAQASTQAAAQAQTVAKTAKAKSEEYRKKYLTVVGHVANLPAIPSDDPIVIRDQVIAKLTDENEALANANTALTEQAQTLTISRDSWKNLAVQTEEALKLSEQRVRAEQIAKNAIKRTGWLREGKGILEGGAVVALAHLLGGF